MPGPKWILRGGGGGRVNLKEMTLDILLETVGQFPISSRKKCFTLDQSKNCAVQSQNVIRVGHCCGSLIANGELNECSNMLHFNSLYKALASVQCRLSLVKTNV